MGVELRWNIDKDGNRVQHSNWYGAFKKPDGKRGLINLGVPVEGLPNSAAFEASRKRAVGALNAVKAEMAKGRQTRKQADVMVSSITGEKPKDVALSALSGILDAEGARRTTEGWTIAKRKWIGDFARWANKKGLFFVSNVRRDSARAYLADLYADGKGGYTAGTVGKIRASIGMAFDVALPDGEPNPWKADGVGVHRAEGDAEFHRTPLTDAEVETLLNASEKDTMAHDLITCGLCTALRRGDVCRLRWDDVDLREGTIHLRTHKTGAVVYLPIFEALRAVLEGRLAERKEGAEYVFPEAEYILRTNPDGITRRVKKAFARAFFNPAEASITDADKPRPKRVKLADVLDKVLEAVASAKMAEEKRGRILDLLTRYADGASYRGMEAETGISRGQISGYLHEAEGLAGVPFLMDRREAFTYAGTVAELTRAERSVGARRASVRDFHSLRTSFVTLALKHGVPVEKITAITGHATVETALRFYAQTKGTDFREDFEKALPGVLTREREAVSIQGEDGSGNDGKAKTERAARLAEMAEALRNLPAEDRVYLARMMASRPTITAAR